METAIVLGTFDGLHPGHRAVIELAGGYNIIAVTFNTPPKAYFDKNLKLLMLPQRKNAALEALGVGLVYPLDFGTVSNMESQDFLEWLKLEFSPALIACGFNYRFGKGAAGDTALLADFCQKNGIAFKCAGKVGEGDTISSSSIRALIEAGDVEKANRLIFCGFGFTAPVLHGDARGKVFGFPTANQQYPENLVRPQFGVYESTIIIDCEKYDAITNIGVRPTYKTDFIGTETFIKGFSGEIYGKEATVILKRFIRKEKKFTSSKELILAVKADIKSVLGVEI